MKKVIFPLIFAAVFYYLLTAKDGRILTEKNRSSASPLPQANHKKQERVQTVNVGSYSVKIRQIEDGEQVTLIPNFEKGLSSHQALDLFDCNFLVNGGFYTPEEKPLGLFFAEGRTFERERKNSFLDGFVLKNKGGELKITRAAPQNYETLEFSLQSGPLISLISEPTADYKKERARRALIARNQKEEVYFLAIHDNADTFSGPELGELRETLMEVNLVANLNLMEAVNLDGGSTLSFVQSGEPSITEVNKSGSFFCVR